MMALPSTYTQPIPISTVGAPAEAHRATPLNELIRRQHPDYQEMQQHWRLPDDLLGGTAQMRRNASLYLPRGSGEADDNYRQRVKLSYLDPHYATSLANYCGRAFGKEPSVVTDLPRDWLADIDLQGSSLARMMRVTFHDALHRGLTHYLVDAPRGPSGPVSLYDERTYNIRPFVRHIPAQDLFDWQAEWRNGKLVLTHVRFYETHFVQRDRWTQRAERFIRVIEPGRYELYDPDGRLVEQGDIDSDRITLVSANINPTGFMSARPLNAALADMNLAHFQSVADQRHIMHHARCPIGVFTGMPDDSTATFGAGQALNLPFEANFKFAETSGIPAQIGNADIDHLEQRMARLALEPLLPTAVSGDRTATEAALGDITGRSRLESAALIFRDAWAEILHLLANIGGVSVGAGTLDLKGNFAISANPQDIVNLQADVREGRLTHRTYLIESKRRNYLSEDLDVEAEIALAEATQPGLLGTPIDLTEEPPTPEAESDETDPDAIGE